MTDSIETLTDAAYAEMQARHASRSVGRAADREPVRLNVTEEHPAAFLAVDPPVSGTEFTDARTWPTIERPLGSNDEETER